MKFQARQRLGDIILSNYHFMPVLERLGISLGFGELTVEDVCRKYGINTEFFLEVISAFHDREYRPEISISRFPISQTIAYLRQAHADYLRNRVPRIQSMIRELVQQNSAADNLVVLENFFNDYQLELQRHISREEDRVFPYSLRVFDAYESHDCPPPLMDEIRNYPISAYAQEHDNMEEKLLDLKSILIKYINVPEEQGRIQEILGQLSELEEDLNDHARLEDLILVPVIVQMEQTLRQLSGFEADDESDGSQAHHDDVELREPEGSQLSDRELEVLREVVHGCINKEIADKLFISTHTVITHRKNITRKLGIRTVAGLTVYAILNNIISIHEVKLEEI
jgi:regulator of cell morphogenesis and NO signaling